MKIIIWLIAVIAVSELSADTGYLKKRHYLELGGGSAYNITGSFADQAAESPFGYYNFWVDPLPYIIKQNSNFVKVVGGNYSRFLYEYGLTDRIGIGLYAGNQSLTINNFAYLNSFHYLYLYTVTTNYPSYGIFKGPNSTTPPPGGFVRYYADFAKYQEDFVTRNEPMNLASGGAHLTFHLKPNYAFDPYIRLYYGGGQEMKRSVNLMQGAAGLGFRYFFSKYWYMTGEWNYFEYRLSTPSRTELSMQETMRYPSGKIMMNVVQLGVGVNMDIFSYDPATETKSKKLILKEELETEIEKIGYSRDIQILDVEGTLKLRLSNDVVFESGSAELATDGHTALAKIASILLKNNYKIRIEGHTDNSPVAGDKFPSNWELASSRAIGVIRFLQSKGIANNRMSAVSHAENIPIASNLTGIGRKKNRRIEIVVLFDLAKGERPADYKE